MNGKRDEVVRIASSSSNSCYVKRLYLRQRNPWAACNQSHLCDVGPVRRTRCWLTFVPWSSEEDMNLFLVLAVTSVIAVRTPPGARRFPPDPSVEFTSVDGEYDAGKALEARAQRVISACFRFNDGNRPEDARWTQNNAVVADPGLALLFNRVEPAFQVRKSTSSMILFHSGYYICRFALPCIHGRKRGCSSRKGWTRSGR